MFALTIQGYKVFFAKFGVPGMSAELLVAILEEKPKEVVLVDIGFKPESQALSGALWNTGSSVQVRDHFDDGDLNARAYAQLLMHRLGPGRSIISNHQDHDQCYKLVKPGEFANPGTVIVADMDLDGYFGSLKGLGIKGWDSRMEPLKIMMQSRPGKDKPEEREAATRTIFEHNLQIIGAT